MGSRAWNGAGGLDKNVVALLDEPPKLYQLPELGGLYCQSYCVPPDPLTVTDSGSHPLLGFADGAPGVDVEHDTSMYMV